MKHIVIIIAALFSSCYSQNKTPEKQVVHDSVPVLIIKDTCAVRTDTVYITQNNKQVDSLSAVVKALKKKLFIANDKVNTSMYYLKIVLHNPTQKKFLPGWIKRAISD